MSNSKKPHLIPFPEPFYPRPATTPQIGLAAEEQHHIVVLHNPTEKAAYFKNHPADLAEDKQGIWPSLK